MKKAEGILIILISFFALTGLFNSLLTWAMVDQQYIFSTALFMAGFAEIFIMIIVLAWMGY